MNAKTPAPVAIFRKAPETRPRRRRGPRMNLRLDGCDGRRGRRICWGLRFGVNRLAGLLALGGLVGAGLGAIGLGGGA